MKLAYNTVARQLLEFDHTAQKGLPRANSTHPITQVSGRCQQRYFFLCAGFLTIFPFQGFHNVDLLQVLQSVTKLSKIEL